VPNRLAKENSPYLLQHADNPVNWYPWGPEAFEQAKKEDKPVFLSIGYATCHWCHVMAHESFEDPEVAELMNRAFVNIKVDREERPDIDHTYMTVCQMLTGSGGWPLTIFMTPDKKPFYAATYIPKSGRHGRPGMKELIPRIEELWKQNREKIDGSADEITEAFQQSTRDKPGEPLTDSILDKAFTRYKERYDHASGGFGNSPKFPGPHNLGFLLRHWNRTRNRDALEMVRNTLVNMRRGGIFDHVGFGFHRYSTDSEWLLPHFEKMLYDQALLLLIYAETWQITSDPLLKQTAEEIATYLFRDMQDEGGAFYSAEDADSEGEEGKFYVWSIDEIRNVLPLSESELFIEVYNIREEGNFRDESTGRKSGKNIPHLSENFNDLADQRDTEPGKLKRKLEEIRKKLFIHRENRERPLLDDKILTDWNGLAVAGLARAGAILGKPGYIEQAEKAAAFIRDQLRREDGALYHRYRNGEAAIEAHADDYAFLIWGLIELYEATFDADYLELALKLNDMFLDNFWDTENGGFYFTGISGETLLGRKKEIYDGAIPSGNSVATLNLLRLGRITGDTGMEEKADRIARLFSDQVSQSPTGFGQLLQAVDFATGDTREIVIAGRKGAGDTKKFIDILRSRFIPNKVVVLNDPGSEKIRQIAPYTEQQPMVRESATAYVCKNYSCDRPVTDPDLFINMLDNEES